MTSEAAILALAVVQLAIVLRFMWMLHKARALREEVHQLQVLLGSADDKLGLAQGDLNALTHRLQDDHDSQLATAVLVGELQEQVNKVAGTVRKIGERLKQRGHL